MKAVNLGLSVMWGDCNLGYCELQIMEEKKMSFLKGDIYYADLNNAIGDVQQG